MIALALIIGLFALYMLAGRHAGPAHLASIAGVAINEVAGKQITNFIVNIAHSLPYGTVSQVVYVVLVVGFPILLYLKSAKEKRGPMTIAEYAIFAILTTELILIPFSDVIAVDSLGKISVKLIEISLPFAIVAGTIAAYVDILFYKNQSEK